MKRTDEDIKQRRQLCKDLDYLVKEDQDIRDEIIDEYVYLLSDTRFAEMQEFVSKELEADLWN